MIVCKNLEDLMHAVPDKLDRAVSTLGVSD